MRRLRCRISCEKQLAREQQNAQNPLLTVSGGDFVAAAGTILWCAVEETASAPKIL